MNGSNNIRLSLIKKDLNIFISRGKALKNITYTLLKKSRKNQKSKKSCTLFFEVLYPSIYIILETRLSDDPKINTHHDQI